MAITIPLSGLNGDWSVNNQTGNLRVWTKGIYSIVYSSNMFESGYQGWMVKITDGVEIFGIKTTTGDPWDRNAEIIWNPHAQGYDEDTTKNLVISVIEEVNPVDINPHYYKCCQVNKSNNRWSGYRMRWDKNEGWVVSNVLTPNLLISGFIPEINKIYNVNSTSLIYLYPQTPYVSELSYLLFKIPMIYEEDNKNYHLQIQLSRTEDFNDIIKYNTKDNYSMFKVFNGLKVINLQDNNGISYIYSEKEIQFDIQSLYAELFSSSSSESSQIESVIVDNKYRYFRYHWSSDGGETYGYYDYGNVSASNQIWGDVASDVYVAVDVNGELKAQKLCFTGITANDDRNPIVINKVGIFNTGKNEPEYKGSTIFKGEETYYKCASINTTLKTWNGYEAIINGDTGVWSFSETLTEELSYHKIIPEINKVYNEQCTFQVSGFDRGFLIPSNGLVFYAPLSTDYKDVVNGYDAYRTAKGFVDYQGKKCLEGIKEGESASAATWTTPAIYNELVGKSAFTIFGMFAWHPNLAGNWRYLIALGSTNDVCIIGRGNNFDFNINGASYEAYPALKNLMDNSSSWCSFCGTRDASGKIKFYYNGTVYRSGTNTRSIIVEKVSVLGNTGNDNCAHNAYCSDFAIYNRALTSEQVLSMHNNLIPQ